MPEPIHYVRLSGLYLAPLVRRPAAGSVSNLYDCRGPGVFFLCKSSLLRTKTTVPFSPLE